MKYYIEDQRYRRCPYTGQAGTGHILILTQENPPDLVQEIDAREHPRRAMREARQIVDNLNECLEGAI